MDEQKLIEAFQLMWGKYPEQVRLIRKDHTIVAGNSHQASIRSGEKQSLQKCR